MSAQIPLTGYITLFMLLKSKCKKEHSVGEEMDLWSNSSQRMNVLLPDDVAENRRRCAN